MRTLFRNRIAAACLVLAAGACTSSGEEATCQSLGPQGNCAKIEGCCTSTDCYFDVNGNLIDCDGQDCLEARAQVDQLCGLSGSGGQ